MALTGFAAGLRSGKQSNQEERQRSLDNTSRRLDNTRDLATFEDFLLNRERRAEERKEKIATSKKNQANMESLQESELEQNRADAETARLEEETADAQRKQVESKKKLSDAQIEEGMRNIRKNVSDDNIEKIIGAAASFRHQLESNKNLDPKQVYEQVLTDMINMHPEGKQKGMEIYNDMGITPKYSEQAHRQLISMATAGEHDKAQRNKEELLMQEWSYRAKVASINAASSKGAKPIDVSYKEATKAERAMLAGDIAGALGRDKWDDIEGSFDTDTGLYTDSKGAVVGTISKMSRRALSNQIVQNDVHPMEMEVVLADILTQLYPLYVGNTDERKHTFSGDDFDSVKFTESGNVILNVISEKRRVLSLTTGKPVDFITVWTLLKQQGILAAYK